MTDLSGMTFSDITNVVNSNLYYDFFFLPDEDRNILLMMPQNYLHVHPVSIVITYFHYLCCVFSLSQKLKANSWLHCSLPSVTNMYVAPHSVNWWLSEDTDYCTALSTNADIYACYVVHTLLVLSAVVLASYHSC